MNVLAISFSSSAAVGSGQGQAVARRLQPEILFLRSGKPEFGSAFLISLGGWLSASAEYAADDPDRLSAVEGTRHFRFRHAVCLVFRRDDAVQRRTDSVVHDHQDDGHHRFRLGADSAGRGTGIQRDPAAEFLQNRARGDRGGGA